MSVIIGFTTLSIELTPVEISGVQSIMISGLMVSALGIKLNALSKLNGQINRKATIPHSRTWIHLGAFFQNHTQKYDRKDQPRCGDTHIYNFQEK